MFRTQRGGHCPRAEIIFPQGSATTGIAFVAFLLGTAHNSPWHSHADRTTQLSAILAPTAPTNCTRTAVGSGPQVTILALWEADAHHLRREAQDFRRVRPEEPAFSGLAALFGLCCGELWRTVSPDHRPYTRKTGPMASHTYTPASSFMTRPRVGALRGARAPYVLTPHRPNITT